MLGLGNVVGMRVWMGRAACVPALARMPAGALCTCPISRLSCAASRVRHLPRPTGVLRLPCVCQILLGMCSECCEGCAECVRARSSRARARWQASCCALFLRTDFGRPAGASRQRTCAPSIMTRERETRKGPAPRRRTLWGVEEERRGEERDSWEDERRRVFGTKGIWKTKDEGRD